MEYGEAQWLAGGMLVFSFLVLLLVNFFNPQRKLAQP
jgi:hypothetical protein